MPYAPKHPCSYPGCAVLIETSDSRCERHRIQERREYDRGRAGDPRHTFYSSSRWRAARERHLRKEPLCRVCAGSGRVTAADTVDHIVPMRRGGAAFEDGNLQSICARCHSRKTALHDGRWG